MKVTVAMDNTVPISSKRPFLGEHGFSLLIEEGEKAVLAGLDGGDVAGEAGQRGTEIFARFAVNPPVLAVAVAVVLIPLRFDVNQKMLIERGPGHLRLLSR